MSRDKLSYTPFVSSINPSFWHKFTQLKIDVYKDSSECSEIFGCFTNFNTSKSAYFEVDSTSFNVDYGCNKGYIPFHGKLFNENTVESFKEKNKTELIQSAGNELWENICTGKVLENPSLLNVFILLSFADLKKYQYFYWFAFPSLHNINIALNKSDNLNVMLDDIQQTSIYEQYSNLSENNKSFFVISKCKTKVITLATAFNQFQIDSDYYFVFSDASSSLEIPSSILKNFILLIWQTWQNLRGKAINIIALRLSRSGQISISTSIIFNVNIPEIINKKETSSEIGNEINLEWVGWERNENGKLGPRIVNLKSSMDPKSLMESSAELNLKLMKWRMMRDIDLDKIKYTKCLLLGSGTLGCSVARTLMGWGVRNITFVDNSTVSYSNPVRQSLFTYDDCVNNRPKSTAAAENLKKIYPVIETKGIQLSIPMPGHTVGESMLQQTKEDYEQLLKLITEHDVIFLLTDSRESRWIPTLLAAHLDKTVINAALGFDTYLVMRHGSRSDSLSTTETDDDIPAGFKVIGGNELGCYFCNDVTAPGNSQKDRTLDQQCTVTRPGVSQIAGSLAVELMISLLQHKLGKLAPAYYKTKNEECDIFRDNECMLGIIPHSIRGFLSSFSQVIPATQRFKQCTCCSEIVLKEYETHKFEFILRVLNNSKCLEDLTGLTEMSMNDELWDLSDNESIE